MVMGSVQFEDAPLMAGRVELYDDQGQAIAKAPIGSDGTFQIPNVAPGTYKVAVKTSQVPVDESVKPPMDGGGQPSNEPPNGPPTPPMPPRGPGGRGHMPPGMGAVRPPTPPLKALTKELKAKYERIDPKYEDPAKSGITCTVTKGLTGLEPWKLQAVAAAPMKTPEKTP